MENSFIAIFIVIIFIVVFIFVKNAIKSGRSSQLDKNEIKNKWKEIENLANMDKEMYYKMAIIEADKLLDNVFKKLLTPGSTMGERLKFLVYKYPNLRKVWEAHSIRNSISHESDYSLYRSSAKKAISIYKEALRELGVL